MPNTVKDSTVKLEYTIDSEDFIRAGEASSSIKTILRQLGIDSALIRRIAIATYEAEINIVIHSKGGKIIATINPDKLVIEAIDIGPGIENIELAMKKGYSTASNKVRELGFGAGMGLPNIKRSCDEFNIESNIGTGTRVQMVFAL